MVNHYSVSYFRGRKEYTNSSFVSSSWKSVNYLDGINAAPAYAKYYGTDASGKMVNDLQATNTVGVIDTGVWSAHDEFNGKVSGYNYDYGPCRNGDKANCWKFDENARIYKLVDGTWGYSYSQMILLDSNGNETSQILYHVSSEEYVAWANNYPSNYNWDNVQNSVEPIAEGSDFLHGSNVAGIIASSWNNTGNLGVAFSNTNIKAVRWDLISSLYNPVDKMIKDKVVAVNMSFGTTSSQLRNAAHISEYWAYLPLGYTSAAKATINSYTTKTKNGQTYTDGLIWVKSAGNDGQAQPDIESGIKLMTDYSKLMILVVVSVDVKLNSNGTVRNYSLSTFSNQCGVAASYCIAAPGGNETDTDVSVVWGPGKVGEYVGMAGTSQAAPVVTGSIAFIKSAYPHMTASEIIDLLRTTANVNGVGYSSSNHSDAKYGAGLLDLGKAVTTYVSPSTSADIVVTASGDDIYSQNVRLDNSSLFVTSSMADAIHKALPETITVFDRYHRAFAFPTAQYVKTTHAGYKSLKNDVAHIGQIGKKRSLHQGNITFAYSGSSNQKNFVEGMYKKDGKMTGFYFSENTHYNSTNDISSDLKNPFMSFTNAYGVYHTQGLGKGKTFHIEAVSGYNGLYDGDNDFADNTFRKQAYALNSEFRLHKDDKFALSLSSGLLYEDEAMLGMNGDGAFAVDGGHTYTAGVSASWFMTPKWTLSGSYYRGYTPEQKFASGLLRTSRLESESFALDANYKWNKHMDVGFRISSPLRVVKGRLGVDFPSGRDNYSDTVYRERYSAGMKSERREYKFAFYANKEVSERLSWSTEFDVRVNPEHQNVANDYRALFGLSWNFN